MAAQQYGSGFAGLCIVSLLCAAPVAAQFTLPAINPVRTSASACAAINSLIRPELAAVTAQWLDAGALRIAASGDDTLPTLASHCRVSATVATSIRIEVWLPAPEAWNGRFLGLGSSGTGGALNHAGMAAALNAGYATASTDDGHGSGDLAWLGNERLLRDFAYRAIYEMTAQARVFIADFYGRPADYRYFNGCALGGRQGLVEAARFPGDYDGIVAGSPAPAFVDAAVLRLWLQAAAGSGPGQPALRPDALALANAEALAQCDAADGAADRVLEDPGRCAFEPGRLQCGGTSGGRCLAPNEVAALRQIYTGPPEAAIQELDATGLLRARARPDTPGLAIGSERGWNFVAAAEPDAFTLEFFRRAVFANPDWSWRSFDFVTDAAIARATAGWLDVPTADLGSFRNRGSKLIVYQGWNDTWSPPAATIGWYRALAAASGSGPAAGVGEFARLFMVPGMAQCGGEAMSLDLQRSVEAWVERGIAPDRIDTAIGDGQPIDAMRTPTDSTRTLCPYPQLARYRGTDGRNAAGSTICAN